MAGTLCVDAKVRMKRVAGSLCLYSVASDRKSIVFPQTLLNDWWVLQNLSPCFWNETERKVGLWHRNRLPYRKRIPVQGSDCLVWEPGWLSGLLDDEKRWERIFLGPRLATMANSTGPLRPFPWKSFHCAGNGHVVNWRGTFCKIWFKRSTFKFVALTFPSE